MSLKNYTIDVCIIWTMFCIPKLQTSRQKRPQPTRKGQSIHNAHSQLPFRAPTAARRGRTSSLCMPASAAVHELSITLTRRCRPGESSESEIPGRSEPEIAGRSESEISGRYFRAKKSESRNRRVNHSAEHQLDHRVDASRSPRRRRCWIRVRNIRVSGPAYNHSAEHQRNERHGEGSAGSESKTGYPDPYFECSS